MKTQSKYSPAEIYKIQQIKREIQYLREKLVEKHQKFGGIKQNIADSEPNKITNNFQEWLDRNDDSKIEPEEDKEKPWGNYILFILLAFYLVVMSFL